MSAAGGTSVPLMLDWLMWLSMPKVNAECEKPDTQNTIIFNNNRVQIKWCAKTGRKYLSGQPTNTITTTESPNVVKSVPNNDIQSASMTTAKPC